MHKIVYLPVVQNDLMEALEYLVTILDAPGAAETLLWEFNRAVQQIAQFPYAHELYRSDRPMATEIRKVSIKNYVLYYAVFPEHVELRRFLHGRRDRSSIF